MQVWLLKHTETYFIVYVGKAPNQLCSFMEVYFYFFPHERENEIYSKSRQRKLGYFWMLCAKSLKMIINSATFPYPVVPTTPHMNLFDNWFLWGWLTISPKKEQLKLAE